MFKYFIALFETGRGEEAAEVEEVPDLEEAADEPVVSVTGQPECADNKEPLRECTEGKGSKVRLECESGQFIYIQSASYGHVTGDFGCGLTEPAAEDECGAANALAKVKERCDGRRQCSVPLRPKFFGESTCGKKDTKYLDVDYSCGYTSKF